MKKEHIILTNHAADKQVHNSILMSCNQIPKNKNNIERPIEEN